MHLLCLLFVAAAAEPTPTKMEWKVDGAAREAIVYLPAKAKESPSPVVFAFHGHGGAAANVAKRFNLQQHWPEAIVVYMQGLNTPGKFDPDGKKPGWQRTSGEQMDRDLKFFDAVLASLRKDYKVDDARIYAMGHSNGGGFTYLLWATRADMFAAFAPSAAGGRSLLQLKPRPVMHLAGEKDTTVPFANQQATMAAIRKANQCEEKGTEWAKGCTLYASKDGAPVVTYIHAGDHAFPAEGSALIVKFFKEHAKK
jgi:polyhydroxybutyrate depolymerase